jgi:YbbR domain-containing protein
MAWHPFRNIGLKIAALGLGTALWITVSGQQVEREVQVQLQFRNVPPALEIEGDAPRTVAVRLSGSSGQISRLEPTDVVATIDLTNARPGVRVFLITANHVSVPLGVEVRGVDPAAVSLTLETTGTAAIPVKPTIGGVPAHGYEVADIDYSPKTVTVSGPESHLRAQLLAVTERISIEGATSPVTETVGIGLTDPALHLTQAQTAHVTVRIVRSSVVRFENRPVTFRNVQSGHAVSADPSEVAVMLTGPREVLAGLHDADLDPYVDLTGVGPGEYKLRVHLDTRGDTTVEGIEPPAVAVRIR